jgi:hypothetical protein
MGKSRVYCALAAACLCVFLGQSVFADVLDSVNMNLTSAGNNILDNTYVGPYTATVNGVSNLVVCDDYADESYVGETWKANVSTYASLPSVHMGYSVRWAQGEPNQLQLYDAAASLIQQMFQPNSSTQLINNSTTVGELQYAVWGVFDPSAISDLSAYNAADGAAANNYLTQAEAKSFSSGEFSNVTIYTPTCGAKPCQNPPQEFITYATPEPSAVIILLADLLLLGTAAMVLRRRGILLAKT